LKRKLASINCKICRNKKDFYIYSPEFEPKRHQISVKTILDSILNAPSNPESFKNDAAVKNNNTTVVTSNNPVKSKGESKTTKNNEAVLPEKSSSNEPCNSKLADLSEIKGKSLNDPSIYKKLLNIAGNYCKEGLTFKVQIAAYRNPDNYKYDNLKQFGAPEIVNYPDGITRFTQLSFTNIKDAEVARKKLLQKDRKMLG